MSKKKKQLEEFFSKYESAFNRGIAGDDVSETITSSFAECFVESSPTGVICGKNGEDFIEKIKHGFEFYRSIGSKQMNIVSKDISVIDDLHAIVKIHWRYEYGQENLSGAIDFNSAYLVNTIEGEPRIFAYVTGDEQKVLREKGLLQQQEMAEQ